MNDVEFERSLAVLQAEGLILEFGLADDITPVLASLSTTLIAIASLAIPQDEREAIISELLTALCRVAGDRAKLLALEAEIKAEIKRAT